MEPRPAYHLEERTIQFTMNVARFANGLVLNTSNHEYAKQLVRSAGSVGANYIEANESLSKKDCAMRLRISRKEAKETQYWLRIIVETNSLPSIVESGKILLNEAIELRNILSSIITKIGPT